jgi:hypothetical protein
MRRKIEQRLDIKLKEDPFNKPQPAQVKAEAPAASGSGIDISNEFLTRVKAKTGLGETSFSPSGSTTAKNLQGVLATIPGGTQFSVEPDARQDGLVNLMQGDQVIKSFDVLGIDRPTQKQYLNEFTEIISNLAGMNGMIDYIGRTGGVQQTGGASQFNPK